MNINFPIETAVKKRYSVRNYSEQEIEKEVKNSIESFIESLDNPFGKKINLHYLDTEDMNGEKKLGTYGVIKGAKQYIGATIKLEPFSLEALGYELETLILYLANINIGTCWLGGTFNRKGFAKAMNIKDDEIFPIITPYGYPAEKKHAKEVVMRKMISADKRKDWNKLFYKDNFETPITSLEDKDLEFALEMVRLGPSASNKQPWRIVVKDNQCDFYEYKEPGYSDSFSYDIQRVDMGIAAAHFDYAVKEKNINGKFQIIDQQELELPENIEYVFSWVREN